MRPLRLICVLMVALLLVGCESDEPTLSVANDSPRFPSDEGVVTSINATELELDGKRRYPIDPEVLSFKTFKGHEVTPLAHWEKRYVHVGVRDDTVVWVAGIGIVLPGPPEEVFYPGVVKGSKDQRVVFEDGTTLALAEGVQMPPEGSKVETSIDPKKHAIVSWKVSGAPPE